MNKKTFLTETYKLIRIALLLNEKARNHGIPSLEDEVEDLDDENFKIGLRMIIDGNDPKVFAEIISNRMSFEKNKYRRLYMTMVRRVVLGIHEGLRGRIFSYVLFSIAGLSFKEQRKIESDLWEVFKNLS